MTRSHQSPTERLERAARKLTTAPAPPSGLAAHVHERLQSERGRTELRTRLRALADHVLTDQLIDRRDVKAIVAWLRWAPLRGPLRMD